MFGKLGWKTILGAAIWGIGQLGGPDVLGILNDAVGNATSAIGGVLSAIGLRHAVAKK